MQQFLTCGSWPLWGSNDPFKFCHLRPLENTNICIILIMVAKLQLWSSNERILWFGVTTTLGTVFKSHNIRKVENYCSNAKSVLKTCLCSHKCTCMRHMYVHVCLCKYKPHGNLIYYSLWHVHLIFSDNISHWNMGFTSLAGLTDLWGPFGSASPVLRLQSHATMSRGAEGQTQVLMFTFQGLTTELYLYITNYVLMASFLEFCNRKSGQWTECILRKNNGLNTHRCTNIHTHTHAHIYAHAYTHMHMCIYTCAHTCTHIHIDIHAYTQTHTCTYMYSCMYTQTQYTYMHTHMHMHAYICIHTYTCHNLLIKRVVDGK
jgi:hypothetical protein